MKWIPTRSVCCFPYVRHLVTVFLFVYSFSLLFYFGWWTESLSSRIPRLTGVVSSTISYPNYNASITPKKCIMLETFDTRRQVEKMVEGRLRTAVPLAGVKPVQDGDVIKLVAYVNANPGSEHRFTFAACAHKCRLIENVQDADLVIFNAGRMRLVPRMPVRRPHQIWLIYSREAAGFSGFRHANRPDLRGVFNWTAAIYSDSTFRLAHGKVERGPLPDKNYDQIYDNKKHDVAWFVSHCETYSKRELYVARMLPYVDVHIYGLCGNMTCGGRGYNMGGELKFCLNMLSRDYKFYLTFENTLCENYLTEKFYNLFTEDVDVIPVVRAGAIIRESLDTEMLVNASDFAGPEHLAKFLKQLSQDKAQYVRMLKNKSSYRIAKRLYFACQLCQALHVGLPSQYIQDPFQFYGNRSVRCRRALDLT